MAKNKGYRVAKTRETFSQLTGDVGERLIEPGHYQEYRAAFCSRPICGYCGGGMYNLDGGCYYCKGVKC